MSSPDRPTLRLVVGLAASAVLHVIVLRTASVAASSGGGPESESAPPPSSAPPQPEITPGIERSDARTLTWIGHEDYREHLARLAEVEQSAFALAPAAASASALAEGDGERPERGATGAEAPAEPTDASEPMEPMEPIEATEATETPAAAARPVDVPADAPDPTELAETSTEPPAAAPSPDALVRGATAPAAPPAGAPESPPDASAGGALAAPQGPEARPSLAELATRPRLPGDASRPLPERAPDPEADEADGDLNARPDSPGGSGAGRVPDAPADRPASDLDQVPPPAPADTHDVVAEATEDADGEAEPSAASAEVTAASDAESAATAAAAAAPAAPSTTAAARAIATFVQQMQAVMQATSSATAARGGDGGAAERTIPGLDAPASDGTAPPRPGEIARRETDATRRTPVTARDLATGRTISREGVEIDPKSPRFLTHERLLRRPRNAVVSITFGPGGVPSAAKVIESTGTASFDESVRDSLFNWRARGSKVDALGPEDRFTFEFVLLFTP